MERLLYAMVLTAIAVLATRSINPLPQSSPSTPQANNLHLYQDQGILSQSDSI